MREQKKKISVIILNSAEISLERSRKLRGFIVSPSQGRRFAARLWRRRACLMSQSARHFFVLMLLTALNVPSWSSFFFEHEHCNFRLQFKSGLSPSTSLPSHGIMPAARTFQHLPVVLLSQRGSKAWWEVLSTHLYAPLSKFDHGIWKVFLFCFDKATKTNLRVLRDGCILVFFTCFYVRLALGLHFSLHFSLIDHQWSEVESWKCVLWYRYC